MGEPVCSVLSQDKVVEAIRALSTADRNRLRRAAIVFCRGRPIEPEDLLQETFARAIDGSRKCPRNIDLVRFLTQAMRSIAFSTTKVLSRQPEFRAAPLFGEEGLAFDPPDGRATAEQQAINDEDLAQMRRATVDLFQDDVAAQVLVEGMMEGMDGEELRATTGLSKVGFASKRRLVRRRLDKALFYNGRKP
jgi:DNA-directed RNA polymerase specialized sigma24 family protein